MISFTALLLSPLSLTQLEDLEVSLHHISPPPSEKHKSVKHRGIDRKAWDKLVSTQEQSINLNTVKLPLPRY